MLSYTSEIDGLINDIEADWLYNIAKTMTSIIEIGSYRGKSTHALLSGMNENGILFSIDLFNTSNYEYTNALPSFVNNVGHFKNIRIIQVNSSIAYKLFEDNTIDMIFIDGDHNAVERDINLYLPKITKLICGHDYNNHYPSVKQVVDKMFSDIEIFENIWIKNL